MEVSAQELRLHDARTHELGFLAAALGAFAIAAAICNGATPTQGATEPICQRRNGRPPEEQGMDSKELAKLIDFGKTHSLDSLLVVRRGKIVAEAYYAPYAAGILHETARSHWMDSIEWESERTMALMVELEVPSGQRGQRDLAGRPYVCDRSAGPRARAIPRAMALRSTGRNAAARSASS
jgi:hypothetical protein